MSDAIALFAGRGELPRQIIDTCQKSGRRIFVIAFEGQTEESLLEGVPHEWVRLGAAGKTIKILKEKNISNVVMAGKMDRPSLGSLRPDAWGLKFLARHGKKILGDDSLLSAIITTLEEKEGIKVLGVDDIIGNLLSEPRQYGGPTPDDISQADLDHGIKVAKHFGLMDVGQGVVVQQGMVLAVEAIEGTDAMLARCKDLKRDGAGGVLVKVKKPEQEARADLPTIGPSTVINAHAAGLQGIALEAGGGLVVNPDEVARKANELGIFVIGFDYDDPS